jgi:hypothetical protein
LFHEEEAYNLVTVWALQSQFSNSQGLVDLCVDWELLDILEAFTCKAFQVSHFVVWA